MAKYRKKTMRKTHLVALIGCLISGVGLATYVYNPMQIEQAIPAAKCWWNEGIFLKATASEGQYQRFMSQNPLNTERLKSGEAQGCFQSGSCMNTKEEAIKALEEQMLGWAGIQGGNLLKGNMLGMLGLKSEAEARARQSEADFCVKYLGEQRRQLQK